MGKGRFLIAVLLGCAAGCGAVPRPTGRSPRPKPASTFSEPGSLGPKKTGKGHAEEASRSRQDRPLRREQLPSKLPTWPRLERRLPPAPKGVAEVPSGCAAFADRKPNRRKPCANGMEALDAALSETQPAKRDAGLVWAEGCADLAPGIVTALRAELAPAACADLVVHKTLSANNSAVPGVVHDALLGLALAARLRRSGRGEPRFRGEASRGAVVAYNKKQLAPWVVEQAKAIQALSRLGAKLRFYGRAIVGVEAGMADLRLVQSVRRGPIPKEFQKDKDLRAEYEQSLELSLRPRKKRGRDAALVALGQLATVGVIRDPRVKKVRNLLGSLYGGRPIHALDALMLPPLKPFAASTPMQRLASRLPSFYAGLLLPGSVARDKAMLRALINRGLSVQHRIALRQAQDKLGYDVRRYAMRARLELAQNYWRSVDVDEALAVFQVTPKTSRSESDRLLLAVAGALRGGPRNAAAMMLQLSLAKLGLGRDLAELDRLASGGGQFAGYAAFDAALLKQIAAPATAGADYWKNVELRFRRAEKALLDIRHKQRAAARADECKAVAAAIAANEG